MIQLVVWGSLMLIGVEIFKIRNQHLDMSFSWESAGGAVSMESCVALSTAEAEYVALAAAAQEAVWLRQLTSDILQYQVGEMIIFEDNQSAICLAKSPQFHGRTIPLL